MGLRRAHREAHCCIVSSLGCAAYRAGCVLLFQDGLFRDIIIESDYDPLHWRESTPCPLPSAYDRQIAVGDRLSRYRRESSLKYNGHVEDPMKRELTKQSNDREGIGGKGLGITKAKSKEILDVKMCGIHFLHITLARHTSPIAPCVVRCRVHP
jgi:hypothetical protein